MSKARELASLGNAYSDGALSNRNKLINGNFEVHQRGTASVTTSDFFADRWRSVLSGATATASRQAFTLGQTDVPNANYYGRLDVSVGNDNARIEYRVEDVKTLAGQTVTLSFYAKGTNPNSGGVGVTIFQEFGTGGSAYVEAGTQVIVLSASWQKYTLTFTLPSMSGKTVGDSSHLSLYWRQPSTDTSTNAWSIDLAQVQLEVGDTATPFEHRSYGQELALCQRFFWRLQGNSTDQSLVCPAVISGSAQARGMLTLPVLMRAAPTIAEVSLEVLHNGNTAVASSLSSTLDETAYAIGLNIGADTGTPFITGQAAAIRLASSASAYIQADAEL